MQNHHQDLLNDQGPALSSVALRTPVNLQQIAEKLHIPLNQLYQMNEFHLVLALFFEVNY